MQQYLPFTVLKRSRIRATATGLYLLQQYLPFTVLKLSKTSLMSSTSFKWLQQYLPFTVLKLTGATKDNNRSLLSVATVLTVYGIETVVLPTPCHHYNGLQQYLPFTVLKLITKPNNVFKVFMVATVLTVYGIETRWL